MARATLRVSAGGRHLKESWWHGESEPHFVAAGIEGDSIRTGSVGDAYDNALAESQIGLFKTEVTRPAGPWRGLEHVELAALAWVEWFNTERPHESIDDLTPMRAEDAHYAARNRLSPTG